MIVESNTNDIKAMHIFALIAGSVGAGKTYAVRTLSEKDTLIINCEAGLLSTMNSGHHVWNIKSVDDLKEFYTRLKNGVKYKNIYIDSLTEISDMIFTEIKPAFTKSQKFGLYEEYTTQMVGFIKALRDMSQYNFFMTTLIKENDGNVSINIAQKSLAERLPAFFDFVFYLANKKEENGNIIRKLISDNSFISFCKSRSEKIELFEDVNLTNIINKVMN